MAGAALQRLPRISASQDLNAEEGKHRPSRHRLRLNLGTDFYLLRRGDDAARRSCEVIAQGGTARPPSSVAHTDSRWVLNAFLYLLKSWESCEAFFNSDFPFQKRKKKMLLPVNASTAPAILSLPFLCSDIFRHRPTLSLRIL